MIRCTTLGPPIVSREDGSTPRDLQWQKNLALLVYLARSPKHSRTRDHLIALLWGDKAEDKARGSLNEALRTLRAAGVPIQSSGAHVGLAAGGVQLDIEQLERHVAAGELGAAAALINGVFCEGVVIPDAPQFDDWLSAERTYWQRRSADVLVGYSSEALAQADLATAIHAAGRALELDPADDRAVQAQLRALAVAGKQGEALAVYAAFAERLERDEGREPAVETARLAARIRDQRAWHVDATEPPPAPLVGCRTELAQLVDIWRDARAGHGAVAVVEGDGGTGKSRLADELASRARLDGAVVLAIRVVEGDQSDRCSGVLALARAGLLNAPGIASISPPLLAQLRGEAPVDGPRTLSEALAAVADEQPVLVLIDDAHWLDRESLLALGVCIRNLATSPVLFVLTALPQIRRAELDEVRAHIGREIAGAAVTVHPLALDDLRELARGAFARYDDVQLERLARRLLVDSAGIPLLAVELLGALAAGLDMQHVSHAWPEPFRTLNQTFPADLPDVLTAALRVNFHSLSADARSVLVAAAVLEGRSPAPLLSHVSGVAGDALVAALDELEWRRWLACEPRGYSFVARIRRDVIARDMVGSAERARMLAAAAQFTPS